MRFTALILIAALAACSSNTSTGGSSSSSGGTGAGGSSGGTSTGGSSGSSGSTASTGTSGTPNVGDCDDAGFCWVNPLPNGNAVELFAGTSDSDVWTVSRFGILRHWDGSSWTRIDSSTHDDIVSIAARAPDDVWANTYTTALHWDGARWSGFDAGRIDAVAFAGDSLWASNSYSVERWDGGWYQSWNPGLQVEELYGLPSGDLYALAGLSSIGLYHFDGGSWGPMAVPSGYQLYGPIVARNADDLLVFAAGASGGALLHWDGSTFAPLPTDAGYTLSNIAMGATDSQLGIVDWSDQSAWELRTWDASGQSTQPVSISRATALWGPRSGSLGWVGGAHGDVAHVGDPSEHASVSAFTNTVLAAAFPFVIEDTSLARFDGTAWRVVADVSNPSLIAANSASDAMVLGQAMTFERWNGSTWSAVPAPPTVQPLKLAGTGSGYVLAAADGLYLFDGTSWAQKPAPPITAYSLAASSPTDVWAGSYPGSTVAHFDGQAWTTTALGGSTGAIIGLSAIAGEAWAVGGGLLARFDGQSWHVFQESELPQDFANQTAINFVSAVRARAAGDTWVGFGGQPFAWHWDGTAFTSIHFDATPLVIDFGLPPTGEVFVLGSGGEVLVRR